MRGRAVAGRGTRVVLVAGMLALVFVCLSAAAVSASAPGWSKPTHISGTYGNNRDANQIQGLSCVSPSFCVAVTTFGDAVTWNGSTWSAPTKIAIRLDGVSCASASFCVATALNGMNSSDNAAGALTWNGSAWSKNNLGDSRPIFEVSCASASFCLAVDTSAYALTWNGSAWSAPSNSGSPAIGAVDTDALGYLSCVSASFCAGVGGIGTYASAFTWNGSALSAPETQIDQGGGFNNGVLGVSCASASFCVAVDGAGYAVTWNGSTWSARAKIDPEHPRLGAYSNELYAVSCASASFCIAVDASGYAVTWNGTAWSTPSNVGDGLLAVSCVSASFCVAGGGEGDVLTYRGAGGSTGGPKPNTVLTSSRIRSSGHSATFRFAATGASTGFQCSLVRVPTGQPAPAPRYVACNSPKIYTQLEPGGYVFYVRAVGPGGPDPTPARHRFAIP
jgi:hypothetical protein